MHLTASESVPLRQQPKLVCHFGLSKHWDAGQATASPSTCMSELHLLSFRRFLGCWPHHALQNRGYETHYQDKGPVVFHNRLVMLFFGVHTCHFHLHVADWVGSLPHLSFHSLPGGACASLLGSSVTLPGCVAATLISLLTFRACCCHPHCITYYC